MAFRKKREQVVNYHRNTSEYGLGSEEDQETQECLPIPPGEDRAHGPLVPQVAVLTYLECRKELPAIQGSCHTGVHTAVGRDHVRTVPTGARA